MTFSTLHIAVTALIVAAVSVPFTVALFRPKAVRDTVAVVAIAGLTTFGWRLVANVDALNADGISWVSANDVLAGFLTYLTLDMFAAVRLPTNRSRFDKLRVAIAAVAIAVNIIAI